MGKITGHYFTNRPPKTLTRKQIKALKQSNKDGRTSQGYAEKKAFRSDSDLISPEDNWARNLQY